MKRVFLGLAMSLFAATAPQAGSYKGYEMPPFQTVARAESYEVRDYGPHIVARVHVAGDVRSSAGAGFRALAGYIFGGNASGEKIAMTVPVGQVPEMDGYEISFMMPARYDMENLPRPKDGRIEFVRTDPERLAVRSFSGWAGDAALRRESAALKSDLERDGVTILGGPRYAYYDDPFTLPWNRRNEVSFVVAK
jgi:hypothetical protein